MEDDFGRNVEDIGSIVENSNTLVKSNQEKIASICSTDNVVKFAKDLLIAPHILIAP